MTEHTPTPWHQERCGEMDRDCWMLVSSLGKTESGIRKIRTVGKVFDHAGADEAAANAALIVRAVNSHAAMKAALEVLLARYIEAIGNEGPECYIARRALTEA